jgi:dTDP-4-dehydrorhamnose reductase
MQDASVQVSRPRRRARIATIFHHWAIAMDVLVTGASGQLGRELARSVPPGVAVRFLDRSALDLAAGDLEQRVLALAPQLILNAAAYTAVDRAESERELAFAVNGAAPGALARAASRLGARLVHVSTDFVFDGAASRPYTETHPTSPLGVYGASKQEGERQLRAALPEALILRTAWVYSALGANFVKTMLRLMGSRDRLSVVADQVGTPTWAQGLAAAVWELGLGTHTGLTLHWTDLGVASWYDFAVAIQEEALARGLLDRAVPVEPIRTEDYPTPACRPAYSVLDKTTTLALLAAPRQHWRSALRGMLDHLKEQG